MPFIASNYGRSESGSGHRAWLSGALALPAAGLGNNNTHFKVLCTFFAFFFWVVFVFFLLDVLFSLVHLKRMQLYVCQCVVCLSMQLLSTTIFYPAHQFVKYDVRPYMSLPLFVCEEGMMAQESKALVEKLQCWIIWKRDLVHCLNLVLRLPGPLLQ